MNEEAAFNLKELGAYSEGSKGIWLEIAGGAMRFVFALVAGERGLMAGFAAPPRTFTSDRFDPSTERLTPSERVFFTGDASYARALRAIRTIDAWAVAVRAPLNDPSLSPRGRHDFVVAATERELAALGRHYAALKAIQAKLAQQHAALYSVAQPDQVGATLDVHVYEKVDRMSTADLLAAVMDGKPEHARMLLALARSPLPLPAEIAKHVDDAWAAKVRNEKPQETASLGLAEEANCWALGLTRFIGALLANPSTSGTNGAFDALQIYRVLKTANAVSLLDYRDDQVVQFEHRIAAIAA